MLMFVECRLPYVHSLKEKRVIRSRMIDRLKRDFQVSAAEVSNPDSHQNLSVGVAAVSGTPSYLNNLPDKIIRAIEGNLEGFVIQSRQEVIPSQ